MVDVAIRVQGLGKCYHIAALQKHRTLRDLVVESATAPLRRIGRLLRGQAGGASDLDQTFWALRDVSFEVQRGDVMGIIGRNGAGKSTLLKILARITQPTEGHAEINGRVGSLLEVGTGFHSELTGRENVYLNGAILGMKRAEIERKFDEIVAFAEVEKFIDTPVKHYSSGMTVRLAFAVAAHLEPEILIVDEVLAVGDAAFQRKCIGKIGEVTHDGRTVLFVSHNLSTIRHLCNRAILLEDGRVAMEGQTGDVITAYQQGLFERTTRDVSSNILYDLQNGKPVDQAGFLITKIELLEYGGDAPLPAVSTWDSFRVRLTYVAPHRLEQASAVIRISDNTGNQMAHLASAPDTAMPLTLLPGTHTVDCDIESLPLAAGEYLIGAGLSIPLVRWLFFEEAMGVLHVHPRDIYQSGFAPKYERTPIAMSYRWRVPMAEQTVEIQQ